MAALTVYALEGIDVAVLEVAWRPLDATSATDPHVVAITGIGLDHMRILGNTLAEIAGEKAAVINRGAPSSWARACMSSVWRVMEDRCRECEVSPVVSSHEILKRPAHLGDTLDFACETSRARYECSLYKLSTRRKMHRVPFCCGGVFGPCPRHGGVDASLAACPTPGRFDVLQNEPLILIDACHNPQSCENFVSSLDEINPDAAPAPSVAYRGPCR